MINLLKNEIELLKISKKSKEKINRLIYNIEHNLNYKDSEIKILQRKLDREQDNFEIFKKEAGWISL